MKTHSQTLAATLLMAMVCLSSTMLPTMAFMPQLQSTTVAKSQPSLPEHRSRTSMLHVTTIPTAFSESHSDDGSTQSQGARPAGGGVTSPIVEINSPQELAEFLNQDDRICVIKFHAAWCKSCQRFGLKFQGLANKKADRIDSTTNAVVQEGPMRFGSIEFGANKGMCRTLNIKRLPTVHLYQKGEKLAGFPCGPAKFPMLQQVVEYYLHQQDQSVSFEEIMQQGDELMSSTEVAGVLEQLIEQDANGSLESAKTKADNNKKAWWKIMP